jgi:hypothetical protein
MPITAESWAGIRVRYAKRLRRSGRAVAAARSTGLRPFHFIHFIAAAVTNRGANLLKEYVIITRL